MIKRVVFCLFAAAFCGSFDASAIETQQQTKERMKGDLKIIHSFFESRYAPRTWKSLHLGWNLDEQTALAAEAIDAADPITNKQFHHILQNFLNTTTDYHVAIWFNSTERVTLPFRVKGVNGRYFVSYVNTDKLAQDVYGIQEGDELVSFDGRPPEEVIQEILQHQGMTARPATDRYIAEIYLTVRLGKVGFTVPKGPIILGFRTRNSNEIKSFQLVWEYTPEQISRPEIQIPNRALVTHDADNEKNSLLEWHFNRMMVSPLVNVLGQLDTGNEVDKNMFGSKVSYIPKLGMVVWSSEENSPFDAYIYIDEEGDPIGYIRIPSYHGGNEESYAFGEVMCLFQETTEALVIDQINNPGGNIYYCYSLASMLTDKPLATPLHRFAITPAEVEHAIRENEKIDMLQNNEDAVAFMEDIEFFGIPVTYQMVRQFHDFNAFIIEQWRAGKDLTDPHSVEHAAYINPHPQVRYTKPILVVINEGDFSGGDFFPAILRDNERATLFGARTAGAGGFTMTESFPNKSAIAGFSYTVSIADRPGGITLEDIGVAPDIAYELTEEDLENGYESYANAINASVRSLKRTKGH